MVLGGYYHYSPCTEEKIRGQRTSRRPRESGQWATRLVRAPRGLAAAPVCGLPLLSPRRRCPALMEGGDLPDLGTPVWMAQQCQASGEPGCGGDASERGPQTRPGVVCGGAEISWPRPGGATCQSAGFPFNHSGCDLKMDSVLWYSSQSHSAFQSDLKSELL